MGKNHVSVLVVVSYIKQTYVLLCLFIFIFVQEDLLHPVTSILCIIMPRASQFGTEILKRVNWVLPYHAIQGYGKKGAARISLSCLEKEEK